MTALVKYEAACRAIAQAKALDEVKDLCDKAEAMRAYAKQAKNRNMEFDAAEIRMRAERRLGQLIQAQKETVGLNTGAKGIGTAEGVRCRKGTAPPTLAEAGIDKKLSSRAQRMAAIADAEFEGMVGQWKERKQRENERITVDLLRAGERHRRDEELRNAAAPWPVGRYGLIYADPAWKYSGPAPGGDNRLVENHYPCMPLDEICALPVSDLAAENCVLFLWSTSPMLSNAMDVIRAWGFDYRTSLVWVKDKIGLGYYFRQRHEHLLLARRGNVRTPEPSTRRDSVLEAPRLAHSAKPHIVYEIIENMYPRLPKLELFARHRREGWDAWGNQINGEDAVMTKNPGARAWAAGSGCSYESREFQ